MTAPSRAMAKLALTSLSILCGLSWGAPLRMVHRPALATVNANPTLLGFGVTTVGQTSNAQTTTITNGTAGTITISSIILNGSDPADFAITTKTCGATLAANATCTISVDFKPTANDIRGAQIAITYTGAAGSPLNVPLTGFAQAPTQNLIFNPAVLTFPLTNIGITTSPQQIQVTNFGTTGVTFTGAALVGPNAPDFAISTNNCTSLGVGLGSCSVGVTFTPSVSGTRTASLQLSSNAPGSPNVVLLLGTGQSLTQVITVAPLSYNFGLQDIGGTSPQTYFAITNAGTASVTMNSISVSGTNSNEFGISSNGCPTLGSPLAAGSTCYVYMTFTPQSTGTQTAMLNVSDTASGSPQVVTLYGVGQNVTSSVAFQKSTIDLGVETLNVTSGQQYVQVQNTGDINVTFSNISLGGANPGDFGISSNGCASSLGPNGQCYVYVSFTPTATGQRTATLSFTDNATGSPQSITLTGNGITATQQLAFNYLAWDFGALPLGSTSSQQYFQVDNTGDSSVSMNSISLTGMNASDFTISSNGCPPAGQPLNAGSSCYVYVTFSPSATGVRTANLQFSDSATGSPQSIALSGSGLANIQTLSYNYPALVFPGWPVNTNYGTSYLTVTNTGDQNVTFSNVGISGPNQNNFSISSNGCSTVTPGSTCYIYVDYFPITTGILSATLQLTDSAMGSPQNIPLAGDGETAGGALSLSTELENFGSVNVGSTSSVATVTVTNSSGVTVAFTQQIVGPNASDFMITNNTCTGSLLSGANCSVTVDVTPAGMGSRLAALQFTVNAVAQEVLLAAVGTASLSAVSVPAILDFGQSNVGTTTSQRTLQVQNTGTVPVTFSNPTISGTNAADFAVASDQCNQLPVGQTCQMNLVFTPGGTGVRTASLSIKDSATGSPQSVLLSGLGQAAKALLTLPGSIDMGTTNKGTPVLSNITLFNAGTATLSISAYAISGSNAADFAITQKCSSINAFQTCNMQLEFSPTATGVRTATLQITSNGTGSPQSIILTGVALAATALINAPSGVSFPATVVGSSNQQNFTVYNIGTTIVNVISASITGMNAGDFSLYTTCTQINLNSSCSLAVNFTPGAAGVRTATLSLATTATGSPASITLTGVGQTPVITLSMPQAIAFPATPVGTPVSTNFYVTNTGNQTVNFSSIKITGTAAADFSVNYANCTSLAPNQQCYLTVTLSSVPGGAGLVTAAIVFTDNAAGSPQSVLLDGIVDGPTTTIGLQPASLTFAAQTVGTVSGAQSISVYNDGLGPVTLKNATITGTNPNDFFVTYNTCAGVTLQGGGLSSCYLQVVFAPSATGARTATLQVLDNAVGGMQTATLMGTGQ